MPPKFCSAIARGWMPLYRLQSPIVLSFSGWNAQADVWRDFINCSMEILSIDLTVQLPLQFYDWHHRYRSLWATSLERIDAIEADRGITANTPIPLIAPPADDPANDF